jgi:putative flippase GtrA
VSFPRFVAVGGLCALLSNAAVIVLVRYGFGSLVASMLAFTPVLLIGYALHAAVTFGAPRSRVTFGRYAFATLMNFPAWAALLYVFCDLLKVSVAIVAPAATAVIFLWNYVSARWAFLPDNGSDN